MLQINNTNNESNNTFLSGYVMEGRTIGAKREAVFLIQRCYCKKVTKETKSYISMDSIRQYFKIMLNHGSGNPMTQSNLLLKLTITMSLFNL
jgi:hypothetical protein